MKGCVVCKNCCKKGSGKSFHAFPTKRNPTLAKKWISWVCEVKKTSWASTKTSFICSDHFEASCFDKSQFRVELMPNSIPTIFPTGHKTTNNAAGNGRCPILQFSDKQQSSSCETSLANSSPERPRRNDVNAISKTPVIGDQVSSPAKEDIFEIEEIASPSVPISTDADLASCVTLTLVASSSGIQCNTGRRRSLLVHDHNYENTPVTSRKKFREMKENLHKARTLAKVQKQHIKRIKKQVQSLKEVVRSLGGDLDIIS